MMMKRSFQILYIGTLFVFLIYILFLSDNNVRRHLELSKQIRDTEINLNKINNYIETDYDMEAVFSNAWIREQYAREQLDMSKPDEEVFLFVYE